MANRYWVGGAGTWNTTSTTNWSASPGGTGGASVPTVADSVFFDQAGAYTVTLTGALNCLDFTVSTGTVTFANGTTPTLAVAGSWSTIAGTVWSATGAITFNTAGSKTITTGGITINSPVTFNNATATWTLQDNLTFGNTLTTTLTAGTLALGSNTLTTGSFNSSNVNTRTINFGTGTIALVGSASATVWNTLIRSGLTILGTPNITSSGGGTAVTKTFSLGYAPRGSGTYNLSLLETTGTVTYGFTQNDTVNNLTINGLQTVTIPTTTNIPALKVYGNYTYAATNGTTTFTGSTAGIVFAGSTTETTVNTGGVSTAYPMVFNAGDGKPAVRLQGSLSATRGNDTGGFVGFPYPAFNQNGSAVYTIEFWVNFNSTPTAALALLQNGRLGAALTVQFSGTTATFRIAHAGFTQYGVNAVFDVPLQEWHHIAIIGNSTNTWIAVNGVVKAFGSLWGEGAYTPNGSFPAGTFYSAAHSGDNTTIYNSFGGYGSVNYDYYISQFRIATGTVLIYNTTGFNPPAMPMQLTGVTGIACFITNTDSFADLSASNGVLQVGSIRSTVATAPTRGWIGSPPVAPTIRLLSNLNLGANALHLTNGNIDINSRTVTASGITISGGASTISNTGSSSYTPAMPMTHSSGTLNLGTNLTVSSGGYTLTIGTLSLGSSTLTTSTFVSNNTNIRTINFGTGKIVLNTSAVNSTVWNTTTNTNLTISGTPLVECLGGGGSDNGPGQAVKAIDTGAMTEANSISFSFLDTTDFVQYVFVNGSVVRNLIFNGFQRVGNNAITIYGSFTHQNTNGTTTFIANTNTWTFAATSGSHNITPVAGYAYDFPWTFNGIGGTWVLQNNLALGGLKTLTFVNGTLDSNNRTITGAAGITMITGTFALTGTAGTTLSTNAPITHTSGTLNLGTNLTTSNNAGYTLTAGTLALGTQTLTTTLFSSSNTSTRTINFGTGKIVLTASFNSTIWNTGTLTGLTLSGTSLVECQGGGVATKTINTGALSAANAISFSLLETTGTVTYAFTASNVVRNLIVNGVQTISNIAITIFGAFTHATTNGTTTFTAGTNAWSFLATSGSYTITPVAGFTYDFPIIIGTTGTTATYTLAANLAVGATRQLTLNNGTVDFNSKSIGGNITFSNANNITLLNTGSTTASWTASITHTAGSLTLPFNLTTTGTYTLTAGSLNLNGYNLTTGIFSSSNSNTRSVAFGSGNIVLATTIAAQVNLAMAVTTGFTFTGTGGFVAAADITRTFEFASTTAGGFEPNLTFTGSGTAVQTITTSSWFRTLNFGTTAFALPATSLSLNSLVLSAGGTFTGLSATMFRAGTITPNGKTIAALTINVTVSAIPTTTLAGSLACTTYTQTAGTLDFATFNLTCSGAATYTAGTLSNIGTITCTTWTCNNTFTLNQGTIQPSVSFVVATGGFNYNGGTLSSVTNFSHTGGVVNLNSNLTLAATSTYTFTTAVTLNLNNFTLTTGIFSSGGTGVRSIAFGTGNIVLSHTTAAQTVLVVDNATNFNWTGTGGFVSDAVVTRTYTFGSIAGGTFYNAPNLAITSGDQIPTFTTNSWFDVLDFTGSSCAPAASTINVDTLTLATGGTYTNLIPLFTRTQTWTSQFGKQLGGIGVNRLFTTLTLDGTQTFTTTSVCSVVTGTLDLGGYDLTIGSFSSSGTAIRSVVFGTKNIILNNSVAGQTVLAVADATNFSYSSISGGFVSDASVTRTYQFGSTAGGNIFNAPNLLINSGSSALTITTQSWFNTLDFTGSACSSGVATVNISNLTLATGGSYPNLGVIARAPGNIIPNGKQIAAFTINHAVAGTTRLLGALVCTFQSYVSGNLDFGGFNLTGSTATYNSGIFSNLNVLSCTTFTIAGNFELITGTITPSTSIVLSSGSLTYTGGTLSPVGTFTHTAGTVVLNKAYSLTATGTYTLTAGSLNLNGYNLTTGIFSSTGTGTRSIAFGTGNIVLAHTTAAQTVLAMADVTNFTQSGTGGFTSAMTVTRTFTFGTTGGNTSNAPNLSLTSGGAIPTFTTNSWFNTLDFTGSTGTPTVATVQVSTLILASGGTYTNLTPSFTRTQTWSMQFGKQLAGFSVNIPGGTLTLDGTQTYTATSLCNLSSGTLDLGGYNLTIGTFDSGSSNTRAIAFGTNNIVLSTTAAGAVNINMPTATNFSWTGTGGFRAAADITRTFTFGTTGGSATNAPNLTFTGSGAAVQTLTTGGWFNTLDFGTTAFNPGTTALNLNSLTLSTGGTYTTLTPTMVGTGTITPNGKAVAALTVNHTGTTTLAGALSVAATATTTLTAGTLNLNGFTLTTGIFSSTGTGTRSIAFGTGNIVLAHTTAATTVLAMSDATNFNWTGTGGFRSDAAVTRTFTFGSIGGINFTANAPNLAITSGAAVVTFTDGSWFDVLDFTGSTSTPAMSASALGIRVDTLTLATGGTYTGLIPVFTRTQTWTSQFSKQLGGIGFNLAGGTLTLNNTQTYTATSACYLVAGTLDLGGTNLTIGTISSNNSNIRAIAFGANNIVLATTTAAQVNLSMADATNFSYTGTGGFTAAADITRTFTFGTTGGSATNAPKLTLTGSGAAVQTLTTGSWFDALNFGTTAFVLVATTLNLDSLTLSTGGTFTALTATMVGTGTITPNGKAIAALTVNHTGTTTLMGTLSVGVGVGQTILTSGTLNLNNFTLTTGLFGSTNTNTRSINFGTANIELSHTTASTTVLSMSTATNFTCTGTGGFVSAMSVTRSFAFGQTAGGRSANAPNLSLTSGAAVPSFSSGSWFNTLNFTGTTSTIATTVNVNSIILATGGTYTGLTVNMVGNGAVTTNGKTIAALNVNSDNPLGLISYKVYKFTSSGSITFPSSNAPPTVDYLVVAGGGGGAGGTFGGGGGGGGGAGGMILSSAQLVPNTSYPVVVGAGGAGGSSVTGTQGLTSSFFGSVAIGGGAGATRTDGGAGGSGGGAGGGLANQYSGGAGTAGQGNAGGANNTTADNSGGGGGAGGAGGNATGPNPGTSGAGGIGLQSSISGVPTYYAGGGGGGGGGGPATGGLGGGGQGAGSGTGGAGTAFLGGGGGGGGQGASTGGQGGSGVVIIRYQAVYADPISTTGSPDVSTIIDVPPIASSADVVTLTGALTATGTTTLTLGTLNLNNFTLTTASFVSNNTNNRAIAFGTGNIALTQTGAGTMLNMSDMTNFSWTGTGGFTAVDKLNTSSYYAGSTAGGSVFNAVNLSISGTGGNGPAIVNDSWFNNVNFNNINGSTTSGRFYVNTLTLSSAATFTAIVPIFTRTQTWTSQFSKQLGGIGFNLAGGTLTLDGTQTYTATSTCNLIAGTLDLGGANLTVGRFVSNNSNTRAIAFGANNIVLATTLADTLNLDLLDATGFSWTGTGGFVAAANVTRRYAVGTSLDPTGAATYTIPGTYTWIVPAGVTSVCVVAVGGGGGSGSGNGSGGNSSFGSEVIAGGGLAEGSGGLVIAGTGGGKGGNGGGGYPSGGGGAGGYNGAGGNGSGSGDGSPGSGGGGGGGTINVPNVVGGRPGGGVGIFGQGANGAGGIRYGDGSGSGGSPGSGGSGVTYGGGGAGTAANPGGGGGGGALAWKNNIVVVPGSSITVTVGIGGAADRVAGGGAVRIIWGPGRAFPTTAVAAVYDVSGSGSGAATAANAPNLTLTGTGTAVQTLVSGSWFKNLNFGTTAFAVPATTINVDTLTLSSTGTYTSLVPVLTRTQTWTSQSGKQLGGIGVNGTGVTVTLDAAQTYNPTTSKLIVNAGTINLAGNSVDFYDVESTGSGSRAITGGGTINVYDNWTVYVGAGFSAAGCTINMASNNFFKTFAGGGGTYGTLVQKSAAPLTITGSNTFESIQVSDTMSPVTPPATIDFLMVAGGGGHQIGGDANAGHGGAGAGGLLYRTAYTIPTAVLTGSKTITVTVGAGGAAANGSNSSIATADNTVSFTTIGGGRGGLFNGNGVAGGSGGGGGGRDYPPGDGGAAQQPASASGGNGFAGGRCRTLNDGSGTAAGGGGGGAGAVGAIGVSRQGGVGGAGLAVPIINTTTAAAVAVGQVVTTDVWFAGGGGGMANGTGGAGGVGGGAPGASSVFQGSGVATNTQSNATGARNGRSNTGGGAGGAATGYSGYGGTGGSGVVIFRHVRIAGYEAATVGCTIEYEGADILYIFKSSGTITF